jgi:pyruvate dehydrogenase E1 component
VSSSTNLGGWLNKVGVWSPKESKDWFGDDGETLLHWRESPSGQHIELGIAETNLVGLLAELGSTWSRWGQRLFPIGVVYDPFVERALEPWSFGIYAGGQSILVGTPSGVSLAPEGGAHQSIKTPSIAIEQPGCVGYEPAFAQEVEWILLAAMARLGVPNGSSTYLRLSTRPVRQALAETPEDPVARERRRRLVLAGGYRLRASAKPALTIAAMGATVPEAVIAAERLHQQGVETDIVCVTSADLLLRAFRGRARAGGDPWILDQIFPSHRATPLITLLDGHPHAMAFLAAINGVRSAPLGVTEFGQSGDLADVYAHHGIDADSVVKAGLDLLA